MWRFGDSPNQLNSKVIALPPVESQAYGLPLRSSSLCRDSVADSLRRRTSAPRNMARQSCRGQRYSRSAASCACARSRPVLREDALHVARHQYVVDGAEGVTPVYAPLVLKAPAVVLGQPAQLGVLTLNFRLREL